MTTFHKRLATVFIGVPFIILVVFGLPQYNHLAFAIVATLFAYVGSKEITTIIKNKTNIKLNIPFQLGIILPISQWLSISLNYPNLTEICLIFLILYAFSKEIFQGAKDDKPFNDSLMKIAYDTLIIFYPNFLVSFIVSFSSLENSSSFYAMFFILVFSNDIFAYIFGILLGKNNRGVFLVSPNKSLAGFVLGGFSAVACGVACYYFVPDIAQEINVFEAAFIALLVSISANIGDLIESVIKRSAVIKDSGKLFPGRGGALDNLDSILIAGPVFYLLIQLLGM
ncbi:MAG: phosphatidate cytidylyltransferase [Spirochaetaceae bacterium]|nr:phosphatidate cytidylyltransferase [Spirochaetaceae bacterium]